MKLTKEQLEQWRPQIDPQEYVAGSAFIGHTLTLGHLLDTIDALEAELAAARAEIERLSAAIKYEGMHDG